jgi:hypothetical protein
VAKLPVQFFFLPSPLIYQNKDKRHRGKSKGHREVPVSNNESHHRAAPSFNCGGYCLVFPVGFEQCRGMGHAFGLLPQWFPFFCCESLSMVSVLLLLLRHNLTTTPPECKECSAAALPPHFQPPFSEFDGGPKENNAEIWTPELFRHMCL